MYGMGDKGWPPSMVRMFDPMPEILAPARLRKLQSSCTCGSLAAWVIVVVPCRVTASMMVFSVAVGLASRSQTWPGLALVASKITPEAVTLTFTPRSKNA